MTKLNKYGGHFQKVTLWYCLRLILTNKTALLRDCEMNFWSLSRVISLIHLLITKALMYRPVDRVIYGILRKITVSVLSGIHIVIVDWRNTTLSQSHTVHFLYKSSSTFLTKPTLNKDNCVQYLLVTFCVWPYANQMLLFYIISEMFG